MHFIQLTKKKMVPVAAFMLTAFTGMAQTTNQAAAPAAATGGSNLLAILLVVTAVILAFVIWGMGQALIAISRQVMEKNKTAGKVPGIVLLLGFSLLSQAGFSQTPAADAVKEIPNYGGLSANNFYAFAGVITVEIFAILFLAFSIKRIYQELLPEKAASTAKTSRLREWWTAVDKKFFTRAVAVEREADIMLDHNYDGIRELDNALPPWWKYGFIFTIVLAFIYLGYFHAFGSGKNPTEEYADEMEKARIEKEIYDAGNKDKVDEKNVPMVDANGIKAGQAIFESKCAACHVKDGGGNVGPNLTDDYWLHKGSLNDIYATIKNGYPEKGMTAWGSTFTPKEISQIASYVKTLRGTKPAAPKAPQGDLYVEDTKTDSLPAPAAMNKTDSASIAKPAK
jgi:cytochrome c oxidase cbb3-type subunit III